MSITNLYKLVLIGDQQTGKTQYVNRYYSNRYYSRYNFKEKYTTTPCVECNPLLFQTNRGYYQFNIWDCSGHPSFQGCRKGYYIKADACIAFYTKESDHEKTDGMVRDFMEVNPEAKLVIVWNKCDIKENIDYLTYKCGTDYLLRGFGVQVYLISVKSMYNKEKPLLHLLRQLTNDDNIYFCG